jgi:ADP-heptose:LPS heptosyltransferase
VAVFRALQLGDLLCTVPALRALRAAVPQAHITLIGLRWAQDFMHRFAHYLDGFLAFPGAPGLPERTPAPGELERFMSDARAQRFDLVLQMHGSGTHSNPIVTALGGARSAGFFRHGESCPDPERYLPYPEHEPEIWRHLRLMELLGVELRGNALEFPLFPPDWAAFHALTERYPLHAGSYACLHPGARAPARRWPAERFAAVGDRLWEWGLRVVLTGTAQEAPLTASVIRAMRAPAIDLAGRTPLGGLAALLSRSRLLICNDTGVAHIAAALHTPSVVIFSAAAPERWAAADAVRHRSLSYPVPCRPCHHPVCPIDHPCVRLLTAEQVSAEAYALLRMPRNAL